MQGRLFAKSSPPPVITAIEPGKADPNLRRIRAGRRTLATLRAADVEALRIKVGKPWTARLAQKAGLAVAALKAHNDATRMLGRRAFSRAALLAKLVEKGHDISIANQTVVDLVEHGWLDDRAYAEALAHEIRQSKRGAAAPKLISAKLQSRGIEPNLAKQVAQQTSAEADQNTQALAFARKQLAGMRAGNPQSAARRLAGALARRGYDEDVISHVLDRVHLADQ